MRAAVGLVLVLLGCVEGPSPALDAGACEVGASRVCACGPSGLGGLGREVCVRDEARGVWVCLCDAGAD